MTPQHEIDSAGGSCWATRKLRNENERDWWFSQPKLERTAVYPGMNRFYTLFTSSLCKSYAGRVKVYIDDNDRLPRAVRMLELILVVLSFAFIAICAWFIRLLKARN